MTRLGDLLRSYGEPAETEEQLRRIFPDALGIIFDSSSDWKTEAMYDLIWAAKRVDKATARLSALKNGLIRAVESLEGLGVYEEEDDE